MSFKLARVVQLGSTATQILVRVREISPSVRVMASCVREISPSVRETEFLLKKEPKIWTLLE